MTDKLCFRFNFVVLIDSATDKKSAAMKTVQQDQKDQNYNAMLHYKLTDKHSLSFDAGHSIQKYKGFSS